MTQVPRFHGPAQSAGGHRPPLPAGQPPGRTGGEGGIRAESRGAAAPRAVALETTRSDKTERSEGLAERVGFEPTCRLPDNTLSRRARYDHFGTFRRGRSKIIHA